jgi:4-hydroxy-tetrahydrodipicolinate synthase
MATQPLHRLRNALSGVSGILVTPFDSDDQIVPSRLAPVVDRAVEAGVSVLMANGTTGGIGRGINDALALTRASRAAGVSALMIHQPPDPFVAPRGVVGYVSRIIEEAQGIPAILYLRDDGIGMDAIAELCAIPNVVGVKWACPTPMRLGEAIKANDPALVWSGGLAETWAPAFYAVGARGFTSGLINVWPERSVEISQALEKGDYATARTLIDGIASFEALRAEERNGANVSVVKAALQYLGEDCGPPRLPAAWPLAEEKHRALADLLQAIPAAQKRLALSNG